MWTALNPARGTVLPENAAEAGMAVLGFAVASAQLGDAADNVLRRLGESRPDALRRHLDALARSVERAGLPHLAGDHGWPDHGGDYTDFLQHVAQLALRYGPAEVFEALLAASARGSRGAGEHATPAAISRLLIALAPVRGTVLDFACGQGTLLLSAARSADSGEQVTLVGQNMDHAASRLAQVRLLVHGHSAKIVVGDTLHGTNRYRSVADLVMADPPFALRWHPDGRTSAVDLPFGVPPRANADLAWMQYAIGALRPGGRALLVTSMGPLFRGGTEAEIRRSLIEAGCVKAVIGLPRGLYPHTSIAAPVLVLSRPDPDPPHDVMFVDASQLAGHSASRPDRPERLRHHEDRRRTAECSESGRTGCRPRLWREYAEADGEGLCPDAQAFQTEAERRVAAVLAAVARGEDPAAGDRIVVFGYDTDHDKHAYDELPERYKSGPGKSLTVLDGRDCAEWFEAFIHAPFADDCAAAGNDTSLAMQVTLSDPTGQTGRLLLFGDLAHDTIMKIFDYSEFHGRDRYVDWDLLLAPHHCSKKVMYEGDGNGGELLQSDVLDAFDRHAGVESVVVASSAPIPTRDIPKANPPHRMAADRYQELAEEFICTMEWPTADAPVPVVFTVDVDGARIVREDVLELSLTEAKAAGRGRSRLAEVAAAAAAVANDIAGWRTIDEPTPAESGGTGPEQIREGIAADRGGRAAPATTVGFGCPPDRGSAR